MSTNTAALTNKKRRDPTGTSAGYKVFAVVILILMTLFFLFPLYWIITGSFKDVVEINARYPIWFPEYKSASSERLYPAFYYQMDIWQFSSSCSIDGIGGRVDANIQFLR